MRVEVYWNLNKGGYSIRANEGPNKGKVIGYAAGVDLVDATFKVQNGGREAVRRNKVKSVHAWVKGELVATYETITAHSFDGVRVTYNPYKYETFVSFESDSIESIFNATRVSMRTNPESGFAHVVAKR